MLPRWHILLGAIFSILFWIIFPNTSLIYLALIFFSSFLIDFDHYVVAVMKRKSLSLFQAFGYFKELEKIELKNYQKGIRNRGPFLLFHTIEFHLLVLIAGLFFTPFLYIFIGMAFHSLCDFYDMARQDRLYAREFFLVNWIIKK